MVRHTTSYAFFLTQGGLAAPASYRRNILLFLDENYSRCKVHGAWWMVTLIDSE